MKISILELVPENYKVKHISDKISISYETKYRYKPHPVIFPKIINVDENFIAAVALYLGDGSFQQNKSHATFTNKDRDVCKFVWDFLRDGFSLSVKDISCEIRYRKKKPVLPEWSKALSIPKEKFRIKYYVRNRDETFHLQINRTIFRQIFEIIVKKILNTDFIENENLRRAFLRGLFAAEGSIGVATTDSPKPYINFISYHLSFYEEDLANLIAKALDMEKVKFNVIKRERDHSIVIRMTGWDNYWKLCNAKIFDICERKKRRFSHVARNLTVNCALNDSTRKDIFYKTGLTQRELAKHLNSWQGNICKMTTGDLNISIDRLILLSKLSGVSLAQIKRGITNVVVGALTPINNYEFIEFIFNLKTNPTSPYS